MEKDIPSWTVIQFINDGSVEAVPTWWIQGDYCHWPPYSKEKLVLAIKKCEPLKTCWPTFKIKSFRCATFDNYMIARNKAKRAEETSDLNTADENETPRRKRVPKVLTSSDSDQSSDYEDLTSVLPLPPKLNKNKQSAVGVDETPKKTKIFQNSKEPQPRSIQKLHKNETDNVNPSANQCGNCNNKDLKTIIQQNYVLRGLVTDVLKEVNVLKEQMKNHTINEEKNSIFKCPGIAFPINTDDEFDILENFLSTESDFEDAVVELSKIGGSSVYDLIKRVMTLLLSNDQTLKYSWLGRKGKKAFNKNNIAAVLIKSVDKSGLGKDAKEAEVAIQAWLRRASDRRANVAKKF